MNSALRSNPAEGPGIPSTSCKVKICGIMEPEHAVAAAEAGAHFIGMVFAPSRRQIGVEKAEEIQSALRAAGALASTVGVFVNETTERMLEIKRIAGLDLLQLSGDETPRQVADCLALGLAVVKAVRFPNNCSLGQALESLAPFVPFIETGRFRFLLDTYNLDAYGGTGERGDWSLAARLARHAPFYLAGGLTPQNVGEAIEAVQPYCVDVSSGVERNGRKDPQLIEDFIVRATASAGHSLGEER